MSLSKFEYLPNEIIHMIFEHLDGFHLVFAFSKLNSRLNSLINHNHLHINTIYCRQIDFDYLFNCIFPSVNNVFSLTISNQNTLGPIEIFLARFLDLIPHNSLRYLKLIEIDPEAVNVFLKTVFPKLTELVALNITNSTKRYIDHFHLEAFESIDAQLPALRNVSLSIKNYSYNPDFTRFSGKTILYRIEPVLSTVTHLSLQSCSYDITGLFRLFEKLCKIEYLQITLDIDDDIGCWGPYLLDCQLIRNGGQNMRSLVIQIEFRILFSEIVSLLKHFPQLEKLSLATLHFTRYVEFYDGQKWEELIQTSLPCLTSFRLYLISKELRSNPTLNDIVNRFRTFFWLNEKKWYIVCDKFADGVLQLYTVPCPKNIVITLNIISTAWDTTLPSFNSSTFDSVTSLKINATEVESNPMPLPYFNNVKSIDILSLPTKNYRLSQHMDLLKLESVNQSR